LNPVIEALLPIIETDPLPEADTSTHWRLHGEKTTVKRGDGDDLLLDGVGFGAMESGRSRHLFGAIERWSYRSVTNSLVSYPSLMQVAKNIAQDLSFGLTFDVWKQTVALGLLKDHWDERGLTPKTFALIGDGYGFQGALIHRLFPQARLYCIDLPKILIFQARTHELADSNAKMSLLVNGSEATHINFVQPRDVEGIADTIDCALNMASMGEMKASSIAAYFDFLRRRSTETSRFYCVNRRRKELPDGDVTIFSEYPWSDEDEVFIDGPCPYYTHTVDPHTLAEGPTVLGMRVPFVNYFVGEFLHRLVRLAPAG